MPFQSDFPSASDSRQPGGEGFYDQIELLSVDLLNQNRHLVQQLKRTARAVRLEFGWHYLLDLTWVLSRLGDPAGKRIMDAGAGSGVIQWYLARQGAEVLSVDRLSRCALPLRFRTYVPVQGLRPGDLLPARQVFQESLRRPSEGSFFQRWLIKAQTLVRGWLDLRKKPVAQGRVLIYNQDLSQLSDIPDNSMDAVVSISALEHNTQEDLRRALAEIMRVIKPGGALLATLMAARDQDTWHAPSSGWCYTETTLRRLFDLPPDAPSNYARFNELFAALRDCAELRDSLASFYFKSAQNGMPWGVWDPQYQPVGICKTKRG